MSGTAPVPELVLASASPARLATLRAAGFAPRVLVSDVDEDAVLRELAGLAPDVPARVPPSLVAPAEQVRALARAKARAVAGRVVAERVAAERAAGEASGETADGGALVLGCDSMLEMDLDGEAVVVGKPRDAAEARARWRAMRGTSGVLHTGHWLELVGRDAGASAGATSSTTVHFADVDDDEIDAYVATGEPLEVAGAFTIDALGAPFVEGIEGDHHGVVGVSLPLLRRLSAEVGVRLVDLWAPPRAQDAESAAPTH